MCAPDFCGVTCEVQLHQVAGCRLRLQRHWLTLPGLRSTPLLDCWSAQVFLPRHWAPQDGVAAQDSRLGKLQPMNMEQSKEHGMYGRVPGRDCMLPL